MVRIRRISKEYYLRQIMACWVILTMVVVMPVRVALAIPNCTDDGGATVDQTTTPNVTDVLVNQQETLMAWSNLNTTEVETVAFRDGALEDTKVFSEITGGKTNFLGRLTGEEGMALYFRNRAGFLFGPKSTVDVTQLLVTSLNIDADDLLDGLPCTLIDGQGAGDITNEGTITAKEVVALVGKNVINKGLILAGESVIMAAGDSVIITENGSNVAVEVEMGADWSPEAYSVYQVRNENGPGIMATSAGDTAQVVLAAGDIWSAALLYAYSGGGEADPVATIDIDAAGDVIITGQVMAQAIGNRETNNTIANITVDAGGDVDVRAKVLESEYASITAYALDGKNNTADVLICADNVTVEAEGGFDSENDRVYHSTASIEAEAGIVDGYNQINTANVQIGAREGIEVKTLSKTIDKVTASIAAYAYGGVENTAGVLACANDDVQVITEIGPGAVMQLTSSDAYIKSWALQGQGRGEGGGDNLLSQVTTTVISHNGDVVVDSSLGGNASIEALIEPLVNGGPVGTATATTQIYATDVEVTGEGSSIRAVAPSGGLQKGDGFTFCATTDNKIAETDGSAVLIIDGSDSEDCPDCPPCPCDDDFFAPVPPIRFEIPRIEGCPELLLAASIELGTTPDTIQVAIGNALALNPNIQPCEACETLVNAVNILRDEDGARMAAMNQVFNEIAPADALFTTEMADSIVTAFAGRVGDGSQYASAIEYIDAFVLYIAALDTGLGSPLDDSVAYVMEKYGEGITGSDNGNIAAFVATRLESLEAFGG